VSNNIPLGFTCECGRVHKFAAYVYAHWREVLIHSCECGLNHDIQYGLASVSEVKAEPKPKPRLEPKRNNFDCP
jgi:hypothetical protein